MGKKIILIALAPALFILVAVSAYIYTSAFFILQEKPIERVVTFMPEQEQVSYSQEINPSISITPTVLSPIPQTPTPEDGHPWGQAWKLEDGSYTFKIQEDPAMATREELFSALNEYRYNHQREKLSWNDTLVSYAQQRAQYLQEKGSDHHAGFEDFIENQNGYEKLGFRCVGENYSYGFKLNGIHLVEWMYAQSPGHNANQLDDRYSHMGTGIAGNVSVVIFGGCN